MAELLVDRGPMAERRHGQDVRVPIQPRTETLEVLLGRVDRRERPLEQMAVHDRGTCVHACQALFDHFGIRPRHRRVALGRRLTVESDFDNDRLRL